ncbi:MAG: LLM class flavin-dependent oxidoreductase [Acidimicrobiales bacterium]
MTHLPAVPLSVLDLAPVVSGRTPVEALDATRELARHVEGLGFSRFWLAEHHNMPGIASSAPTVLIAAVAAVTERIRVGSGGVMLPNHPPLVVAEQFGTLEALYPGRIDLGLGRAPGTDQLAARALRRDPDRADDFPREVMQLQAFLAPEQPGQALRAMPGAGSEVPLWILGSSLYGAQLAAALGLPYAFASHFAPDALLAALQTYRADFQPSDALDQPYAMIGVNVTAADTDAEARRLFTTVQQGFTNLRRGTPGPYPPPIDDIDDYWTPSERVQASHMLTHSIVGSPETVRAGLERITQLTGADELMVVSAIYDHDQRVRSYEILAEVAASMSETSRRAAS